MAVEVEEIPFPCLPISDVRHALDISTTEEERPEQDLGDGNAAPKPSSHASVESAAPTGPETVA